jgi:hypothetical protein
MHKHKAAVLIHIVMHRDIPPPVEPADIRFFDPVACYDNSFW